MPNISLYFKRFKVSGVNVIPFDKFVNVSYQLLVYIMIVRKNHRVNSAPLVDKFESDFCFV